MEKLVEDLNGLKIIQNSGDWSEDLPEEIWQKHFKGNFKQVADHLDVDTHRWYETSITVINVNGFLMGIEYITNMFSESQDFEDCYHTIKFYEMKEVKTTTYETI